MRLLVAAYSAAVASSTTKARNCGYSFSPFRAAAKKDSRYLFSDTVMRCDTVELVKKAVKEGRRAYVLVNNRSEGNAPLTVQALADTLAIKPS
jgi:uncharacterized protein YecE (DUF72 family)